MSSGVDATRRHSSLRTAVPKLSPRNASAIKGLKPDRPVHLVRLRVSQIGRCGAAKRTDCGRWHGPRRTSVETASAGTSASPALTGTAGGCSPPRCWHNSIPPPVCQHRRGRSTRPCGAAGRRWWSLGRTAPLQRRLHEPERGLLVPRVSDVGLHCRFRRRESRLLS